MKKDGTLATFDSKADAHHFGKTLRSSMSNIAVITVMEEKEATNA